MDDIEKRGLWIPAMDLLRGIDLGFTAELDGSLPHLQLNSLLEKSVGTVVRMLQEYFPDRFCFRVLAVHDELADHPPAVDLGIFAIQSSVTEETVSPPEDSS